MILIRLHGGLGNQMFQYALGRSLSLAHNTSFKVDTSYLRTANQSGRSLRLQGFCVTLNEADRKEILPYTNTVRKTLDRVLPVSKKKYVHEVSARYKKEITTNTDAYFDGHWTSEKYFIDSQDTIRKDFQLKNPFGPTAHTISKQIKAEKVPVSVHIRRGDYVSIQKIANRHGVLPLSYYEAATDHIVHTFPQAHFFVFSDDIAWAKENYPKKYPVTFVSGSGIEDYEELVLMSTCAHNIIANSTFSWWSAWLNQNPTKIVIAPKQWVTDPSIDTADILPETWTKLS
jgi:hypothetical protein